MDIQKLLVEETATIQETIIIMDRGGIGIVFIVNKNRKVLGILTDGDFRRAVLKGIDLDNNISSIINKNFVSIEKGTSDKIAINVFLKGKVEVLPVLENGKLDEILLKRNFFLEDKIIFPENLENISVIIMAGGKGTRMKPFTNILPKPLLPIGEKTMLEVIMDEYNKYGLNNFTLPINYKGAIIKSYFAEHKHKYNLTFIEEKKYLGTAGALSLLKYSQEMVLFISNCDIIIKHNYLDILKYHNKQKNDITLVAAMMHYNVPYGVCSIKNGGELDKLSEKPKYDMLINTGMYILNSSILELIPENEYYDITHLLDEAQKRKRKIGVYPVLENSWIDVGQWTEYRESEKLFGLN